MCKFSLEAVIAAHGTIDATQGDDLEIRKYHGFQKADSEAIVCLHTGTEMVLSGERMDFFAPDGCWGDRTCEDVVDQPVIFEERAVPTHWDAGGRPHLMVMDILVKPDGRYTVIHYLCKGTTARVLQVPQMSFFSENPKHVLEFIE